MKEFYIKIIVEGKEEEAFFDVVKEIGTNEKFHIDIENVGGFGGIADAFLVALREDDLFDCIICVYDVDNRINDKKSPYNMVRNQLNLLFGNEKITESVSFCTNPNIMQLFLLAADTLQNVTLSITSKKINTSLIHKYWPEIASGKIDKLGRKIKQNYDASNWQLDIIKYSILNGEYSYNTLLENAKALSANYKKNNIPGSNLLSLLLALKDGNKKYFSKIRKMIDDIV